LFVRWQALSKPTKNSLALDSVQSEILKKVGILQRKINLSQMIALKEKKENSENLQNSKVIPRVYWENIGTAVYVGNNRFLTNKHLLTTDTSYQIISISEKIVPLEIENIHPNEDLASLQIKPEYTLENPFNSAVLETNINNFEAIYSAGNPDNFGLTISSGEILNTDINFNYKADNFLSKNETENKKKFATNSNQNKEIFTVNYNDINSKQKYIRHNAKNGLGSSGGGLFNTQGKLVGLNTFSIKPNNSENTIGITDFQNNGALRADLLENYIDKVTFKEGFSRLEIDARYIYPQESALDNLPAKTGVLLNQNPENNNLNLYKNDFITSANNIAIDEKNTFGEILKNTKQDLNLGLFRKNQLGEWEYKNITIQKGYLYQKVNTNQVNN